MKFVQEFTLIVGGSNWTVQLTAVADVIHKQELYDFKVYNMKCDNSLCNPCWVLVYTHLSIFFAVGKYDFNILNLCQFGMVCDFVTDFVMGCTTTNKCEYTLTRYWAYQPEMLRDDRSV
jgi:hypothetical protein